MKKLIFLIALFLSIGIVGCDDKEEVKEEKLSPYEAKGYVLGTTLPCEGNALYIEVVNPKGIGKKGIFQSKWGRDNPIWNYENAIGVPHFYKLGFPNELMKKGTFLHFKYREYDYEKDSHYFEYEQPCFTDKIPPTANYYIITEIISPSYEK